jgi:hypothetical protein
MHTACREKYARSQDRSKEDPQPCFRFQDEAILPGPSEQVKSRPPGSAILLNGVWRNCQSGDWRSQGAQHK